MTITTDQFGNHILTADEGRAIHQRGMPSPCSTVRARLAPHIDPATWEDCDFGEPEPTDEPTMEDKDATLRRFGVEV